MNTNPITNHMNNSDAKSTISYIHVDSARRSKFPNIIPDSKIYNLPPYPLYFKNGSNKVVINFPGHPFQTGDKLVLNNINSKNIILQNILMVKKNSCFVRFFQQHHGLSIYGLYDPLNADEFAKIDYVHNLPTRFTESDDLPDGINEYYVLKKKINMYVQFSNIKGSNNNRTLIGNIPINYLNRKQRVYMIFRKNGFLFEQDPNSYLIALEKKSSINYADNINFVLNANNEPTSDVAANTIYIKFHNLYGVPLNYLNSDKHCQHLSITDRTKDTIVVDIGYPAIVDPKINFYHKSDFIDQYDGIINNHIGGGIQCYIRKIITIEPGFPNPNQYTYSLDRIYKNVVQAKIISSIFPNSQKLINNDPNDIVNNKLYWRNLSDGEHIYQLSITPGNYYSQQLKEVIETKFNQTPRIQFDSTNNYNDKGYNKYHIVTVDISEATDIVSISSFREVVQHDDIVSGPVLSISNNFVEFTTMTDLCSNFGIDSMNLDADAIVPQLIKPFDPELEELFIYLTPNSHCRIEKNFSNIYFNLYKYVKHIPTHANTTFLTNKETERRILLNFHRTKLLYPSDNSVQELHSINTPTMLTNFDFNYLTNEVNIANHKLHVGDIIITDQFIDPNFINEVFVYEIISIVNPEKIIVKKYNHGEKYKFIYDSIIINFGTQKNSHYWFDQITPNENTDKSLSFSSIVPLVENNNILRVKHPCHQLDIGCMITISGSNSINYVPASAINREHYIFKIIDDDHYEIILDIYIPEPMENYIGQNMVSIKFPDLFQLLFESRDTIGKILSFDRVGEKNSITPYKHTITNIDKYIYDDDYSMLGSDYKFKLKKISMYEYNYFYICSPELSCIGTSVPNVFATIYWMENSGASSINSFVTTTKFFSVPTTLSELHFSIHHPDGRLVEFNKLDHSFTIEIIEGSG